MESNPTLFRLRERWGVEMMRCQLERRGFRTQRGDVLRVQTRDILTCRFYCCCHLGCTSRVREVEGPRSEFVSELSILASHLSFRPTSLQVDTSLPTRQRQKRGRYMSFPPRSPNKPGESSTKGKGKQVEAPLSNPTETSPPKPQNSQVSSSLYTKRRIRGVELMGISFFVEFPRWITLSQDCFERSTHREFPCSLLALPAAGLLTFALCETRHLPRKLQR